MSLVLITRIVVLFTIGVCVSSLSLTRLIMLWACILIHGGLTYWVGWNDCHKDFARLTGVEDD